MHKNPIKRILAVVLAMTLIVASLPLLAGRLMTAFAGTNVGTFAELKNYLADGATEIQLNDNITLEGNITIPMSCTSIKGDGFTINTAGFTIYTASTSNVTIDNVTFKGGTKTVISNAAGSKMVIKNSNIRENNLSSGSVIDNSGTMVLDGVGVNENKMSVAAVNNSGTLYTNNVTVAGNVSNSNAADTGSVKNAGNAYLLNTTVAGNKARGVFSAGATLKMVNDIIENNVATGGTKNDIIITNNAADNLLAYSVYDGMYANTIVTSNAYQVDGTTDLFCDYDSAHFPLVYKNMVYLKSDFSYVGTSVYFDYATDLSSIAISYDKKINKADVLGTANTEVTTYQDVTTRGSAKLIGASYTNSSSYYKVTLDSLQNGSVSGIGLLGTVVKAGDKLELTATPSSGYTFRRLLDVTDSPANRSLSTSNTYELTPTKDTVVSAEFGKEVTYGISLFLDGVAWPGQTVELYQYGVNQNVDLTYAAGKYTGTVFTGEYDVYVDGSNSNQKVTVTEGTTSGTVKYSSIEFLANGGTGNAPAKVCVPTGSKINLPTNNTLAKEDYNFTGWIKQGGTTVYAVGSEFTVSNGTKLYANWLSKSVTAKAVINLKGEPNSGFDVKFQNKTSYTFYDAQYANGAYSISVPNSATDMYDVIVDGSVIDTMTCTGLNNLVYNYYSVTYHGNGNTNTSQGDVVKKVLAGSSYALESDLYEKTGNAFVGWNTQAAGGGTIKNPGNTVTVNADTNYYAQWTVGNYTVTFVADDGSTLTSRDVAYGSPYGTLPTTTAKAGYTFGGWYNGSNQVTATTIMNVASNHTLKAKWIPVKYDITPPANSTDLFTFNGNATADHGDNYTFTLTPKNGYSVANAVVKVKNTSDSSNEQTLVPSGGVYTIPSVTCAKTITVTGVIDTLPPTGEISVSTNKWTKFLDTITFGKFFKDTQSVKITAIDPSGVASVSYLTSSEQLSQDTLDHYADSKWTTITNGGTFSINPDDKLIVYAKLIDRNGYTSYISSDGLVLDHTAPVIAGVTDGQTYTGAQTVKVTDEYLALVTVDDVAVIPDEDDNITVTGKPGTQTIVAKDMAGNVTSVTITVNRDLSVDDGNITKQVDVLSSAPDTMVTQTKEELKNMLLTDDDLEAVDAGEDINLLVKVRGEDVVPQDDKDLIEEEMSDKEIINIFDISVFKEYLTRDTSEKLTTTNEKLTFVFDIPDEYLDVPEGKTRTFYLGRVHDDALEYLDDKDAEASKYTADSDKFSTYVLAYKDAEGTTATTVTADTSTTTVATTDANGTSTTTAAPSEEASTSADGSNTNGEASGGAGILTEDNAPILITAAGVLVAGVAIVIIDKKRKESKKTDKLEK